ncbi:MAG: oligosaccharide flippase family protein [Salinivirgaceae bacterium]|nr:oligosaccharide flippase family protein [Salinivirgaceae bacterium]
MNGEHKEILKHSGNYLLATIANKALSFITVPVYTYLLTVEDYGVLNVFSSTAQVVAVLLTLNTEVAISRYYYDAENENDFKCFVGTSIRFSFIIFSVLSVLLFLFRNTLADYMGIESLLVVCLIPFAINIVLDGIFQQIYQPLLESRKIAIVSCISSYLAVALSVVCMLMLQDKRYYGLILGTMITFMFMGVYKVIQVNRYSLKGFDIKHLKYILRFCLPYLPYSLSSIIVAQFGKMIIGQQDGFNSAGLYSFAQNISALMLVVIVLVHSAWNPYYFKYMNNKDYERIDGDYDIIWRVTLVIGAFLSLFCYEMGIILARPQYLSCLYQVPILVLGYLFYQWSYVYLRNTAFAKKTIWNAVVVVSAGVFNVVLNAVLIKYFQSLGVAISFAFSYLFMLLISWIINRVILKVYATSMMSFIKPFIFYLPIICVSICFKDTMILSFETIGVKLIIFSVFTLFVTKRFYIKWLRGYFGASKM